MKRLVCIFLCAMVIFSHVIFASDAEFDYPHFMYRMEADDFDEDFKALGKTYTSPPIIVPYSVSGAEDSYILSKSETNEYVKISVDGYSGGGENSYETLVNAVEAYFCTEAAQFVRENFKYGEFGIDKKMNEEIGDYYFSYLAGNNHRGYSVTVKREPIFIDLILTDEDSDTYRPVEVAAVIELFGEGVINGMSNGVFAPDINITRAQFAAMFVRLIKVEESEYKGSFTDVPDGKWYTGAVETLADMGYIKGYGDGNFHPDDTISYQDMFVVTYRYLYDNNLLFEENRQSIVISDFMAEKQIKFGDYAKTAIDELYARSLIRYPYLEIVSEPGTRIHIAEFLNGVRIYADNMKF